MVCHKKAWADVSFATFHFGLLMSTFIGGYCSDKFGRRSIFIWAPGVAVLGGVLVTFANSVATFTIGNFLLAFSLYMQALVR